MRIKAVRQQWLNISRISMQSLKKLGKILLKQFGGLVTSGTNKKTRTLSKNNLVILCRQSYSSLCNQQSSYFVFVQLSFRFGVVIPANQVESDLSAVRSDIETSKVFNPEILPDGTSYVFLTRDFKLQMG